MSNYGRSNLGQLKCVRLPSILGAISAIIIEYINSVYTPLRYFESENHIYFTHYFVHEILRLLICNFAGKSALTCNIHYILYIQVIVVCSCSVRIICFNIAGGRSYGHHLLFPMVWLSPKHDRILVFDTVCFVQFQPNHLLPITKLFRGREVW